MKLLVAAALAAFALPAFAQDTPPAAPPAAEPQSAPAPAPMPPADPAAAPAPMPAPPMAAPMPEPAPPATTDGNYPPCTKTVTDHCTERSNARGERLHSTPRKPG